jgi:hypothetical protein
MNTRKMRACVENSPNGAHKKKPQVIKLTTYTHEKNYFTIFSFWVLDPNSFLIWTKYIPSI